MFPPISKSNSTLKLPDSQIDFSVPLSCRYNKRSDSMRPIKDLKTDLKRYKMIQFDTKSTNHKKTEYSPPVFRRGEWLFHL